MTNKGYLSAVPEDFREIFLKTYEDLQIVKATGLISGVYLHTII
jgi:hypothetical protein